MFHWSLPFYIYRKRFKAFLLDDENSTTTLVVYDIFYIDSSIFEEM